MDRHRRLASGLREEHHLDKPTDFPILCRLKSSNLRTLQEAEVFVGHINLSESFNGAGEHFVRLLESLQRHNVEQYVLVRNIALAKRLDLIEKITVGPVVRSPVTAYCLMPHVDVVHIHDRSSWPAGLLLTLTKTIPFTLTHRVSLNEHKNPLYQAAVRRASGFIEENDISVHTHIQIYRQAIDSLRVPTMLL